jgi:peptidoglycan/LPS O-acetylase OafA/YrhL
MIYRKEIDGLRAIAVLPVIFFHAGFEPFSGGFIGVDVFFVISGFLITTLIIEDVRNGRFSIINFYERRARRILPALFFVMLVSIPFAWLWLSPWDLREFFQSLVAISLFASNFLFWNLSGYFDTAAELKPMLHTWSLAVEEQYYVLFPLVVMAGWRLGAKRLFILILLISIASLTLAQSQVRNEPSAAFFLLPARAWELLLGSLAAFMMLFGTKTLQPIYRHHLIIELLGILGLGLILFSMLFFDAQTPFPGLSALVPTIGTALIILFASQTTLVGRLLTIPFFVGVGLISYSAYLWHQPIFAFARHITLDEPSVYLMLLLSLLTLALAYISWRFIEQPFRSRTRFDRKAVFKAAVFGMMVFASMGLAGHFGGEKMTEWRLSGVSPEQRAAFVPRDRLIAERRAMVEHFKGLQTRPFSMSANKTRVLILGDSMSEDFFISMMATEHLFPSLEVRRFWLDDPCMPYFTHLIETGELTYQRGGRCRASLERIVESQLFEQADVVVLTAYWVARADKRPHIDGIQLARTIIERDKKVILVGVLAMKDASSTAFKTLQLGLDLPEANHFAYRTLVRARMDEPNRDLREFAKETDKVAFMDKFDFFCSEHDESCRLYDENAVIHFSDNTHVSAAGARFFGAEIARRQIFDALDN